MARELTLTGIDLSNADTENTTKAAVPTSVLRKVAGAKRTLSLISKKSVLITMLAGCVLLNIHLGAVGFMVLAIPYSKLLDRLFE